MLVLCLSLSPIPGIGGGGVSAVPLMPELIAPADSTTFASIHDVPAFTWSAVEGASAYQVRLNDGERTSPWLASTSWQPNDLRAGLWKWQVRAKVGRETSPWSSPRNLTIGVAGDAWRQSVPALQLAAEEATVGTPLTANGTGFAPGEIVTVHWLSATGILLAELPSNESGAFTTPLIIPETPIGDRRIIATGSTSGASTEAWMSVIPSLRISPSAAPAGTPINVTLSGFGANEAFNLLWAREAGPNWGAGRTGVNGSAQVTTTMPEELAGIYEVFGTGVTTGATAIAAVRLDAASSAPIAADQELSGGNVVGPATFRVTATVEGLIGGTTSAGEVIERRDRFVSLPACTTTSCPWLEPGTTDSAWAERIECGDRCFVRVTNPDTGICAVAPVLETGPWFTLDDWWNPSDVRHINTLPTSVYVLAQGYPASEAALDGYDLGFGRSSDGTGISNKGYVVGNRSAIDLSNRTWQDIGFDLQAGIGTIDVTILWMTDEDIDEAAAACIGQQESRGPRKDVASADLTSPAADTSVVATPESLVETSQRAAQNNTLPAASHLPNPGRIQSLIDAATATVVAEGDEVPVADPEQESKRRKHKDRQAPNDATSASPPPAEDLAPEPAPVQPPTGEPVTAVFYPVADTSVTSESPDRPQPEVQRTVLPLGGPSDSAAYITFQLDGVAPGSVVTARLVVTGAIGFWGPVSIGAIPGYWVDEPAMTWNTQPLSDVPAAARDGSVAAYIGLPANGEVIADVTGTVGAGGVVTFVLRGTLDAGQAVGSRESGIPCRLEVEYVPQ